MRLTESSFFQANLRLNQLMQSWVVEAAQGGRDLLEIYCGNGNFTLPASSRFQRVLATEIDKNSLQGGRGLRQSCAASKHQLQEM